MQKGYKARIYPTKAQRDILLKTFGSCRFVYNHFLAERIRSYKDDGVSLTYDKGNIKITKTGILKSTRIGNE